MPGKRNWLISAVRRISGMPDYEAYLEHLRRCHPDHPTPSQADYFTDYLRNRYGEGPTRCC
jgi:uncharacterized short protein YbdD (DUF466 family)